MIVLVGKSCSGKDSVAKILLSMGYHKIVTYTTRPKRDNERDGFDYNFVDKTTFMNMAYRMEFAEYRAYITENGVWYYGSKISDYTEYRYNKKVIILTLEGLKSVRRLCPNMPITAIYLDVSNRELKRRMINRANISGEDIKEVKRRYKADKKDFKKVKKFVDYVVCNQNKDALETALICKELDEIKEYNRKNKR